MTPLYLYNSLSRRKEEFKPAQDDFVGLYTCGPTVYNFAHIGNLRTYIFEDILKRVLLFNGYRVKHVMNITDVGHLTGDRDMGEDKMEKGALREGKTVLWLADMQTPRYYAYREGGMPLVNAIQPMESDRVSSLMFADMVVISRRDLAPEQLSNEDALEYNYFKLTHEFTGFEIWELD